MKKKIYISLIAISIVVLTAGCGIFTGGLKKDDFTIEKDKAEELELEVNIGAGELNISDGADEWAEGTFEYNHKKFKPDVSYKLKGEKGTAVIKQGKGLFGNMKFGEIKNNWDISLNNDIALDLFINAGASDTNIDLSELNLTNLEVNAGVGDVTVDLSGEWEQSFDAVIHMGVGETTIILPKDIGVKIETSNGIGDTDVSGLISKGDGIYVNEAYEDAEVIINLQMELGIGDVNFQVK